MLKNPASGPFCLSQFKLPVGVEGYAGREVGRLCAGRAIADMSAVVQWVFGRDTGGLP
jgi:hypothetical protein